MVIKLRGNEMVKCNECEHYNPLESKPGFGTCFDVEIPGNRDPKDSQKCKGKYFKPKQL